MRRQLISIKVIEKFRVNVTATFRCLIILREDILLALLPLFFGAYFRFNRMNGNHFKFLHCLERPLQSKEGVEPTRLYSTNKNVDHENYIKLQSELWGAL